MWEPISKFLRQRPHVEHHVKECVDRQHWYLRLTQFSRVVAHGTQNTFVATFPKHGPHPTTKDRMM
jgi:hypothetical protein